MKQFLIAPSILSADFARLGEVTPPKRLLRVRMSSISTLWITNYVPNLTIGPMVLKALRNYGITAPIDVHLMVKPVDRLVSILPLRVPASSLSTLKLPSTSTARCN